MGKTLSQKNILFLAKEKPFAREAADLLLAHFPSAQIIFGQRMDPFPENIMDKEFDYIMSYISPWVVPAVLLEHTKLAAINFHPGSPEYPGIGCTNFAIYEGSSDYGVTVHHMAPKVDTGKIIKVMRFPIFPRDSVYSLTQRCYGYIYILFVEILDLIIRDKPLPLCRSRWMRKPFTRRELDDLCCLRKSMSENEIKKRTRAATYPGMPGARWVE